MTPSTNEYVPFVNSCKTSTTRRLNEYSVILSELVTGSNSLGVWHQARMHSVCFGPPVKRVNSPTTWRQITYFQAPSHSLLAPSVFAIDVIAGMVTSSPLSTALLRMFCNRTVRLTSALLDITWPRLQFRSRSVVLTANLRCVSPLIFRTSDLHRLPAWQVWTHQPHTALLTVHKIALGGVESSCEISFTIVAWPVQIWQWACQK